jgi:NAD(P)-dependent dehydrogenase (short-subunit alcohol dehydrogenase family)
MRVVPDAVRSGLHGLTAIVTGGANGIGARTVSLLRQRGANVVIADLASSRQSATSLISSVGLNHRDHLRFIATDIANWAEVKNLFRETQKTYGGPHLVVANAGIMETKEVLDLDDIGEDGELREPTEAYRVFDINLKGTFNSEFPIGCLQDVSDESQP